MPSNASKTVPTGVQELLGYRHHCECGLIHETQLAGVHTRKGALEELESAIERHAGRARCLMVTDSRLWQLLGEKLQKRLERAGRKTAVVIVPDGPGQRPHATSQNVALVEAAMDRVGVAVSVGSGTVNDLTKLAAFRRGIPYVCVATAASMNGYTSSIAAIMAEGVKRTVSCKGPIAVIADIDIIAAAPRELTLAGLGDLESKPTATADFFLSGAVTGEHYCDFAEAVVRVAEKKAREAAPGLRSGDVQAVEALTEALILSGVSMALAGTSSPASGGEHLISHYWDMTAELEGRVEGWHGAQVGVATTVTAALYDRLRGRDPRSIDVDALVLGHPTWADLEPRILRLHGPLGPLVAPELEAKHQGREQYRRRLEGIIEGWSGLWSKLDARLRAADEIRGVLRSAGAPTTVGQIKLTPDHLRRAYSRGRHIRSRYTVLDFAHDIGLLEDGSEEVLQAAFS